MLCDRRFGIGADGFVQIIDRRNGDLEWVFLNSDGSDAEFCGNAARCVAAWADAAGYSLPLTLHTRVGNVALDRASATRTAPAVPASPGETWFQVTRELPAPFELTEQIDLAVELKNSQSRLKFDRLFWTDTGVPHFVALVNPQSEFLKGLDEERTTESAMRDALDRLLQDCSSWIAALRPNPAPRGSNITLMQMAASTTRAVTFERGVENFTLSCGTGVIAAARVALHLLDRKETGAFFVQTPGGTLAIEMANSGKTVHLRGPAHVVFQGQWKRKD